MRAIIGGRARSSEPMMRIFDVFVAEEIIHLRHEMISQTHVSNLVSEKSIKVDGSSPVYRSEKVITCVIPESLKSDSNSKS